MIISAYGLQVGCTEGKKEAFLDDLGDWEHSRGMNSRVAPLKFVCPRITHAISIFVASQLHFLANRNPELADGSQ